MIEQSANANVAVLALDLPVKVPAQGRIIDEAIPRLLREPGVTVHRAGGTEHKVQRLTLRVVSDLFEAGGARRVLQYLIDRDGRGSSCLDGIDDQRFLFHKRGKGLRKDEQKQQNTHKRATSLGTCSFLGFRLSFFQSLENVQEEKISIEAKEYGDLLLRQWVSKRSVPDGICKEKICKEHYESCAISILFRIPQKKEIRNEACNDYGR